MKYIISIFKNKFLTEITIHLIFWFIALFFFTRFSFLRFQSLDLYEEYIALSLLIVLVYVNQFVLIPYFFNKLQYLKYFAISTICLIIVVTIEYIFLFDDIRLFINNVDKETKTYILIWNYFYILFRNFLFIGFFTMIKIYKDAINANRVLKYNADLEKQNYRNKIDTLKSKINSHFFFNTLDSIYSLSLTNSEKTQEMITNLSDLMRYIVKESDKEFIEIDKEIYFLNNYIEIEKIKNTSSNVKLSIIGTTHGTYVPPMIFESFVNNAFKYTNFRKEGFIEIIINIKSDTIDFQCKNLIDFVAVQNLKTTKKGIINTCNRLKLIYKNNYKLDIKTDDLFYCVSLSLKKQN